jgi:uncharacterized protein
MTVTLITGASSGIGADLARQCARHHHHLILVARSYQPMTALADEIIALGAPAPLIITADLADPHAIDRIEYKIRAAGLSITGIINNAGFGLTGPSDELSAHEQLAITDVNIRALLALTLRFLPDLKAARGRILNVASIASFMPGPYMAVYYASKAFVLSYSRALRSELAHHHISVSTLCPGLTATQFQQRAGMDPSLGALMMMSSPAVAAQGFNGWQKGSAIIIPGMLNKFFVLCASIFPAAWMCTLIKLIQVNRRAAPQNKA